MYSNLDIALTVFFAIFVVLDIFVNVILGLAIHRKKSLQKPMNLLIFHLAIIDVLIGVFIIPRHLLSYAITYPNSTSSDYVCKLITGGNFIWTSVTASSGILTIIALERLFAVVFPHKNRLRITKSRLKWLVVACWLSSFAFNLPSLLVLEYDHVAQFCLERWPSWVNPKAYVGLAFFAGNFSVFSMFILYGVILYSLWKKNKGVSEVSRTARTKARKRVTKMLILMTIFHMLCRTPNYTFYMLIYFDPEAKYGSTVYSFTVFLILLNSASHPFFYCWYMDNLRRQVFAMLPPICSGHCPARLRSFNLVSTGEEMGSSCSESKKIKLEPTTAVHSFTVDESEEEMQKKRVKRYIEQGVINKEMDISDSSGKESGQATPMIAIKNQQQSNSQYATLNDAEKKDKESHQCNNETTIDKDTSSNHGILKDNDISLSLNNDEGNKDIVDENSIIQQNENAKETESQELSEENSKDYNDQEDENEQSLNNDKDENSAVTNDETEDMKQVKRDGRATKERSSTCNSGGIPDIKDIILESEPIDV